MKHTLPEFLLKILPENSTIVTVHVGYVVTDDGEIIDHVGNPFEGTVSDEHLAIALERQKRSKLGAL